MEEIKNSYALQRYSEKIKSAPLLENNKELLLKFIEHEARPYQWSNGRKYAFGFTMLINVIKEVNDIDLSNLTNEKMHETFERLNNLRWLYSASSFAVLKQHWTNFLEFVKSEYNLDIDPTAELKEFNIRQKNRFITISKPMD